MSFDLNVIIFLSFLIINLALGLWSSRGVTNIKEYAVGNRDFNTGTLVAAIVALWVSGEFFATIVTESYKDGLIFMSILVADFFSYVFIGQFFAPRLHEFLGKISIAEAMGGLYGERVRVITAISGFIGVSGVIAIQLQIAGLLFEYALGISVSYGIIISGIIITLYSSLGGIKAVTFTDVIQFLTFGIVIPSIGLMLFAKFGNESVIDVLSMSPKFSFSESFSFANERIYYFASLFLWLLIPAFAPAVFQRISMAKDVTQVRHSFVIAAFVGAFLAAVICWIAMLLLSKYPNLEGDDIF
ncbi:MAG: hypothetical protein P8P83_01085 [Rickettsiaceae bacterium]|nr:hypothetical protein [Rickettsiaceae bacterium]